MGAGDKTKHSEADALKKRRSASHRKELQHKSVAAAVRGTEAEKKKSKSAEADNGSSCSEAEMHRSKSARGNKKTHRRKKVNSH